MTKSTDKSNFANGTGTSEKEDGRTSVRCRSIQTTIQLLNHLESKSVDFQVCSVNVRTLRGKSGEIVEILKRRHLLRKRLNLGGSQLG